MSSPPEILLSPRIPDIHKSFSAVLKSLVSTAYAFPRWQKHSCVACAPVPVQDDDEQRLYTFHDDIKDDPRVKNAFHQVSQLIQWVFTQVQSLITEFRKYDNVYHLWDSRTLAHIERLKGQNKPMTYFDSKMRPYVRLWKLMDTLPLSMTVQFLKVDVSAIVGEVKKKAREWLDKYCSILMEESTTYYILIFFAGGLLVQPNNSATVKKKD
ncbi:Dynein heavy chain family protein [Reticulomyxa filosa]|uniref:Dynein heavy chain family protein n=1 Tax=Reticulomyxa filosa TaxID=46433 RepID=X6N393_RETFI|nr:Dynein heavy chain family protein [Reticulomyxa filosa]|eukprot:ETO20531.1 Dynein heavy chain family protein [Reticulomyxa filosa]